ncbi:MAG: Periplasmic beta-glucosidase precursor [Bacteroidetes bacterium ADurb.BinA395]|nr:MAG: Periplasmic beta-glucosidase precursor [Bacteroidetes bacterium ADurb.BinA395]HOF99363.1 glycoside hydrolase family 3 N-terminal domain-containing protein [Paludibacteraceae bacterium]HOR39864.1 glycoside hydrolase family 3 N-terminal domain-containing protein [Paludibacteraceae bacterium]HPQ12642.1 glycoside hydrolase family 3 N-terminal domain-containing protein [Paludibacteraceae bacterium]
MKNYLSSLVIISFLLMGCTTATQTSTADKKIDAKVDSVLKLMTLDEKIGQMVLYTSDWDVTGPTLKSDYIDDIRSGKCGNIFNAHTVEYVRKLQKIAVEESRLGIPLLFGYDVIHGHKTIFPISLGESASWDLQAIEKSARIAATEAGASGLNWTFAPMVDISVEPRWGRVSEGAGEDPFLGSQIAAARVRGFQGNDLADTTTVLACVKHFAAYGAPLAGRDYNTVDMSQRVFLDVYLPPYKAAIDAGALSVMSSFNEFDGVPATGNKYLLTDILRNQLGFKGFVVSDYTSVNEMVHHGIVANEEEAALLAIKAGLDMDMQGEVYAKYLKGLLEKGLVDEKTIDQSVRRILKVKFKLGLFDDPYRYCNEAREKRTIYAPEHLEAAFDVAKRSMVLLKNDNNVLPLKKGEKIAVIGELAASKRDLLGSWKAAGDWNFMKSVLDELKEYNGEKNVLYAEGCKKMGDDRTGFAQAIATARRADKIVMVIGEDAEWTGEAASRSNINVPGVQTELLEQLKLLNKPLVVVLMNGRPLVLTKENKLADAILEAWFPGTMGGKAITYVLYGEYNPSGKLTMTFPQNLGQVPIFYYEKNTGRPIYLSNDKYKSKYLDCPNDPLFPFGFGLSYTTFEYSDITLSTKELQQNGSIKATVTVTNTGKTDGEEVVQCYIRDMVGSVTRPVKELKGFEKIFLKAGESKEVSFTITPDLLAFHRLDMTYGTEPGDFKLFIGGNSRDVKETSFKLID